MKVDHQLAHVGLVLILLKGFLCISFEDKIVVSWATKGEFVSGD